MVPILLVAALGIGVVLLFRPRPASTSVIRAGSEPPSLSDQLRSKAGATLASAGSAGLLAAGKSAISSIFSPAVSVAAVPVAPAVAVEFGTAAAFEATGAGGLYAGAESAVVVGAAEAGAAAAPVAYGAAATAGIVALFAAPVVLAMIFGAKAGAKKAEAAQGASSDALQRWPAELERIAPALNAALEMKDYTSYMNALPWGTINAAASYGGGSTKGQDFTTFRDANRLAFAPILEGVVQLAPDELLVKLGAVAPAPYWAWQAPPVRIFPSSVEYPGVILLILNEERRQPGTIDQRIRDAIAAASYVPDSK